MIFIVMGSEHLAIKQKRWIWMKECIFFYVFRRKEWGPGARVEKEDFKSEHPTQGGGCGS